MTGGDVVVSWCSSSFQHDGIFQNVSWENKADIISIPAIQIYGCPHRRAGDAYG